MERSRKRSSSAGSEKWREVVIGKNGEVLFDRPKPTAGCSANGRRRKLKNRNLQQGSERIQSGFRKRQTSGTENCVKLKGSQ